MKGRFGKFDVILICVVIAAVAAGGYLYLGGKSKASDGEKIMIEFDVTALNLSLQEAQSFKEREGENIIFGKTNIDTGKIKRIKIESYRLLVRDTIKGERRWEEHPSNYQVTVTIEKKALQTKDMFIGDKEEIRIGELTPIKGKGFGCSDSYITDLRVEE